MTSVLGLLSEQCSTGVTTLNSCTFHCITREDVDKRVGERVQLSRRP